MVVVNSSSHWQAPLFVNLVSYVLVLSLLVRLGLYDDKNIEENDKTVFVIVYLFITIVLSIILVRLSNDGNLTFAWLLLFMYMTLAIVIVYSVIITMYVSTKSLRSGVGQITSGINDINSIGKNIGKSSEFKVIKKAITGGKVRNLVNSQLSDE
jgi:hypothetical protein